MTASETAVIRARTSLAAGDVSFGSGTGVVNEIAAQPTVH
jgi:hypothetical protein